MPVESTALDRDRIVAGLSTRCRELLSELALYPQVDSTNAEAARRVARGAPPGLVCIAEQQTAGRGRRGRPWISPLGGNVYLSLAWEFEAAAALEGLSLAAGVAATDALQSCGVAGLQLKWPNDILFAGKKLGGILIELSGSPAGRHQVVLGLGLNVYMHPAAAAGIDQQWTDLASVVEVPPARDTLVTALLNELLPMLPLFGERGFAHWRERWMQRDAFAGQRVEVKSGDSGISGSVAGIDASGALLLDTEGGVETVHGGEVSLRPAP